MLDLDDSSPIQRLAEVLREHAEALGYDDAEDLMDDLRSHAYVWECWENRSTISAWLSRHYDWIVYRDNYPEGCTTYAYVGAGTIPVTVIESAT